MQRGDRRVERGRPVLPAAQHRQDARIVDAELSSVAVTGYFATGCGEISWNRR